jgi:hypothetical protein
MADSSKSIKIDNFEEINEEKSLFEWNAPERAFQKRDRDFWITAIAILVLVSVILFFIKEMFLIIALGSVLFLYYVLSTVPPESCRYKITNRGLYFGEVFYPWNLVSRFWFKTSLSSQLIEFETNLRFPRQISLVINSGDQDTLKKIILKRLPMIESSPTFVDKLTKWFSERLPLENREKTK